MKSTPRSRLAAAKPVRSPTTPPPSATSVVLRSGRWSSSAFISSAEAVELLAALAGRHVTERRRDAGVLEASAATRAP